MDFLLAIFYTLDTPSVACVCSSYIIMEVNRIRREGEGVGGEGAGGGELSGV